MSGEARDFNNMETRALIKFFFFPASPKETHAVLRETLQEHASSCATVKNCVALYKLGNLSTCVAPRP